MSAWTVPSYAEWAVPGYTEDGLLGQGISGRVVAAVEETTGRRVAIKYLASTVVGDPALLWEFRSEVERLRTVDAPNLVRTFDYVEQPGQGAALVMELVDGVSLRDMLARRGRLSVEAALVVLKDSLLGLAAGHLRRVPHRDLKPENVLIDARGQCKVSDFGLAVKQDKQIAAAGTPAYMAPEQWNGAANSPATDMYAATVVFFECLTGSTPFTGRPGQLRRQHETAAVPVDRFDPPLQGLIARGMAKDPAERPHNARSFANEVETRAAAVYGPHWEQRGREELGERTAALLPLLAGGGGGSAALTRLTRRRMLTYVSLGAAALVVLGVGGAFALSSKSSNSTQLSSSTAAVFNVQAAVTPPVAASKCTTATSFTYAGTITATTPASVSYRWVYSSGKQGPVQTMNFTAPGQTTVTGETVKSKTAGSAWAEIQLISPAAKTSNKASYKLLCNAGANSGISAYASVQPASLAVSTCSAAAPALTATGTITASKAETVTYYWALANGQNSAASTVRFTAPGTLAVAPLTIKPPALPAKGDAVLVVTSPLAAASGPAPYTVSCTVVATKPPNAAGGTKSASPSPKTSTKSASPKATTPSPSPSKSSSSPAPSKSASTPPSTPVSTPPSTPASTPASTPPSTPASTPASTPPSTPASTPASSSPGATGTVTATVTPTPSPPLPTLTASATVTATATVPATATVSATATVPATATGSETPTDTAPPTATLSVTPALSGLLGAAASLSATTSSVIRSPQIA